MASIKKHTLYSDYTRVPSLSSHICIIPIKIIILKNGGIDGIYDYSRPRFNRLASKCERNL